MDTPSLLTIERASFPEEFQWNARDFTITAERNETKIMLAEQTVRHFNPKTNKFEQFTRVIGFVAYSWYERSASQSLRYYIENMAVLPEHRRERVGTQFISHLKSLARDLIASPYSCATKFSIHTAVKETNLLGHLFLKSNGFRAVKIINDYYLHEDNPEAAYRFVYSSESPKNAAQEGRTTTHP
jgi:ribosomal protein S18 acetylase RimI-like enzyme